MQKIVFDYARAGSDTRGLGIPRPTDLMPAGRALMDNPLAITFEGRHSCAIAPVKPLTGKASSGRGGSYIRRYLR